MYMFKEEKKTWIPCNRRLTGLFIQASTFTIWSIIIYISISQSVIHGHQMVFVKNKFSVLGKYANNHFLSPVTRALKPWGESLVREKRKKNIIMLPVIWTNLLSLYVKKLSHYLFTYILCMYVYMWIPPLSILGKNISLSIQKLEGFLDHVKPQENFIASSNEMVLVPHSSVSSPTVIANMIFTATVKWVKNSNIFINFGNSN